MAQKTSDPNASIGILATVPLLRQQTRRMDFKGGSPPVEFRTGHRFYGCPLALSAKGGCFRVVLFLRFQ
jgi:hypothetical protein